MKVYILNKTSIIRFQTETFRLETNEMVDEKSTMLLLIVDLTSPFVTNMDTSETDRNPEPGAIPYSYEKLQGVFEVHRNHRQSLTPLGLDNQLSSTGLSL